MDQCSLRLRFAGELISVINIPFLNTLRTYFGLSKSGGGGGGGREGAAYLNTDQWKKQKIPLNRKIMFL